MVYVIIGIALLLIAVPIVAVLPNARQKAQMIMRKKARDEGISVELTTIVDPHPKQDKYTGNTGKAIDPKLKVAAYRVQRRRERDWRELPKADWCWVKTNADGWHWSEKPESLSDEVTRWLDLNIRTLPDDVEQVEEMSYNISVYWHERNPGDEQQVFEFLKECIDLSPHPPPEEDPDAS